MVRYCSGIARKNWTVNTHDRATSANTGTASQSVELTWPSAECRREGLQKPSMQFAIAS